MKKTRKLLFSIIIVLAVIISIITVSFAISVITGVRGGISVSAIENTVTHDFTSSTGSLNLSFNKAGDKRTISIETSNRIDSYVHTSYGINIKGGSDENLTKAILVYFNGEYVDTLNNIITIDDEYSFVSLSGQRTDTITFELHQAADSSIFDSKSVSIDVTAYSETVDYSRFIYVSSSSEFKKAVDDINTGLLSDVSIVLCNSIALSDSDNIVIKEPVKVYLDGMTLSGFLTIDDDELDPNALLILSNDGIFNASVTLGEYDTESAKELVIETAKENLSKPVPAGTSDKAVVGNYKLYGVKVTPDSSASYNKNTDELTVLSTSNALYTSVELIEVGGEKIEYKVIGSKVLLLDNILSHMPSEVVVRRDIYLPTFIPSENATIVWTSENPDIMNNEGVIVSKFAERESVTLDAEIKVNDEIYTLSYSFLVSAHNNEINFYKLVQYISPLIIKESNADYFLPVVGGDNDYRSHYNIFNLTDSDPDFELYEWESYKEIFLTSLIYSLTDSQREDYDFITITGDNAVSLNRSTFATYAKITVTGTFDNGESHSTTVNVSIAIGSDTQLMEKAFNKVDEEISKANVLGNILKTRKEDGFLLKKVIFH